MLSLPAEALQRRLAEQVVAVLADAVETREDAPVVDALALDVEEGALAKRVVGDGVRRRGAHERRCQQRRPAKSHRPPLLLLLHLQRPFRLVKQRMCAR